MYVEHYDHRDDLDGDRPLTNFLGQVITIGRERYTVGEALFQPSLLGLETHGIVEQLVRTISTVTSDNHRQLLENTVVCGGTSSMTGKLLFFLLFCI